MRGHLIKQLHGWAHRAPHGLGFLSACRLLNGDVGSQVSQRAYWKRYPSTSHPYHHPQTFLYFCKGEHIQKDWGKETYRVIKDTSKPSATHISKDEVPIVCNYLIQRK